MNSQLHDKPLFDNVLEDYYKYIFKFVVKQISSLEDAKDLTQEIFIKAYNNFGKYNKEKAEIKTWIFVIANNHIINYWKSSYVKTRSDLELDLDYLQSDEDILERLIQEEEVKYILSLMCNVLNKRNLRIMNLYFFSQLSTKEISGVMKMNRKTVSNIISLSINKIKSRLEEQK